MMHTHSPPLLPTAHTSFPLPWNTSPWLGVICSRTPRVRTCRIRGIAGGGDYPTQGPLLCQACGGAQSGPRGQSDSRPDPGSPSQDTPLLFLYEGKKSYMYRDMPGRGGFLPGPPLPPRVETGGRSPVTLPLITHFSRGRSIALCVRISPIICMT